MGLSKWHSGKEYACPCKGQRFDLWVGKIPWRRKWQRTPVFFPGKSHGQRRQRVVHDLESRITEKEMSNLIS